MGRLNVKALMIAGGVLWGLYMLFIGWSSWLVGWGSGFVAAMSSVYIGFRPTFFGGIVGAVWGFIDGAVAGAIIAWVYNAVAKQK
ncbi:MAG: bacteriophage holin [Candidatus Sulfobium sp.]